MNNEAKNSSIFAAVMAAILRSVGDLLQGTSWLFGLGTYSSEEVGERAAKAKPKRPDMSAPRRALARNRRKVDQGISRTLQSRIAADCE